MFVAQCLAGVVAPPVLADAKLLASELVSNSVRHSGAAAGDGIEVAVELGEGVFHLSVVDPGVGKAIAPRPPDWDVGGGFGLHLVESLSKRWGVEPDLAGGTRVWVEVSYRRGTA